MHRFGRILSRAHVSRAVATPITRQAVRHFSKKGAFPGATTAEFTNKLEFLSDHKVFDAYRVLDEEGKVTKDDPKLGEEQCVKMYETMVRLNVMDNILLDAQRQGRISFYMTSYGEEGSHIGSAAALEPEDQVFAQYRETGVLMWRGFTLMDFANQCFSNKYESGKGRQMPVHYGSQAHNFHTISSPLGTQIPQAAGAGYKLKLENSQNVVICYFGDGAASEGDFHAALNFAATLDCQVIFFCRNNGFAISTPTKEQYRGDGIAARGPAYGIATARVDGNDVFAVYNTVKQAREYCVSNSKPVLIEAMSYRVGHHSTSDDSARYREKSEVEFWQKEDNPIHRLRHYLEKHSWWNDERESALIEETRNEMLRVVGEAETTDKAPFDDLFNDVYDVLPAHLEEQKATLKAHLERHPDEYPKFG